MAPNRPHRGHRVVQVGGEQDAAAQLGAYLTETPHDPVIEAVYGVALGGRTRVQHREQTAVVLLGKGLHLDPHIALAHQLEHLAEQRERLAVADAELPGLRQSQPADVPATGNLGVVMHDQPAVAGGMDVQLDPVRVQHDGSAESCPRVLVLVAGSASVGDDAGSKHGHQR